MRFRVVLGALVSHWRRRRIELATLLVGLMAATALWSGVQALNAEARASYARAEALLGVESLSRIEAPGGGRVALADYATLRRAGWPVSPVIDGALPREGWDIRVIGVEPFTLPDAASVSDLAIGLDGDRIGAFLTPPGLALAAPETVARLADLSGLPPLAAADLPPDTLVVDIGVAERLIGAEGEVSYLLVAPGPEREMPEALAGRLDLRAPEGGGAGDLGRLTDSFHLNLTAFGFLSFVVGLFIVNGAIGLAFEQRRPMLRSLRACGVSARLLTAALLAELVGLALAAGIAGVALGYLIAAQLLPDVAASLRGLYGARVPGTLGLQPWHWAAGLAVSLLGALAAGASSLWRAARLPLLATAQPQAWLAAERGRARLQAALAVLALAGALAALAFGGGLVAGFTLLAGLLVGSALLLPTALAGLLALGARAARGPLAQWFWADARAQISGLSLALMALLIALAVNVGVGAMVGSFRDVFDGWLDQRLAAEVYVRAIDADEAARLSAWLDARPEVTAQLPARDAETRIAGRPVEVEGFTDHATYRDAWPLLAAAPDAWDRVAAGDAALVSEQLARRAGLALGDELEVPTARGDWRLDVAGVYSDYGNPLGQIMVSQTAMTAWWPEAPALRRAIRVAPGDAPGLIAALRDGFGIGPDRVVDQEALKALSTRIFERTFAVTVALNALTLAVAGVALLTSLLTLSGLRLGQLAPLWAMGVTRRRLAAIEVGRTLALAGLTAVLALPLGLAVAWVLTAVVNVEAFGWRLPVRLFPGDWVRLFGLALLTALAASLRPAARLRRAEPASLLREFSNER